MDIAIHDGNNLGGAHANAILAQGRVHDFQTISAFEGHRYIRHASFGNELLSSGKVDRFQLTHSRLRFGHITIDMVQIDCGSSFEVIQVEQMEYYTFKIPLEGTSEYRIDGRKQIAAPGHLFATNPVEHVRKRFIGPYSQIIVRVPKDRLEAFLAKELARPLREPLEFDLRPHWGKSSDQFIRFVRLLWTDLGNQGAPHSIRVVAHLENALMASMLTSVPNNYSGDLEQTREEIAPYYVRKAENFIHGQLGEPISIDDIVAASGASSRSLYYGFRRWRQTTPMGFLKAARLDRARSELTQAAQVGGTNVTEIALRVGYHHLNHFSCDYKARFGERPSDTLRRG